MNLDKMCYKIFHIPGYGESHQTRSDLSNYLDSYLINHIDRLDTETILISNKDQYDNFNKEYFELTPKFDFKWGEMGIWASNLLAFKNFLDTDYEYLMLMEDDITTRDNDEFLMLLNKYMDMLPEDWEIFSYFVHPNQYGRYYDRKSRGIDAGISMNSILDLNNQYELPADMVEDDPDDSSDIVKAYQDWSMLCYIVNRKSAKKMFENILHDGIDQPIDWYAFNKTHKYFKSYTLSPKATKGVGLYNLESTFQEREQRAGIYGNI